jgi:hypothetical protein
MFSVCLFSALELVAAPSLAQDRGSLDYTSGSSVEIDRVQPPTTMRLAPGSRVTFLVNVNYTVAAEEGAVSLIIQRAEPQFGSLTRQDKFLSKGSGNVSFIAEVEIPQTRRIDVIVAMYHRDRGSTTVTDMRTYEVVRQ